MTKDEQQNLKFNSENTFLYYFDKRSYFTKNSTIKDNY